jgi:exosortase/archaeosortase family protein
MDLAVVILIVSFVFAVLASPSAVGLLARVPYLLMGTLLLLAMNFVRIVSLYYIGIYYEEAFDIMHIDVWQAVFIFVPLVMWITWARRTGRELRPCDQISVAT